MTDLVKLALAKFLEKETKEFKLGTGTHLIEETVTLKIQGAVIKKPDTESKPTTKIPLKETLALCLKKAGIQGPNIEKILVESITEALASEGKIHIPEVEAAMTKVDNMLASLPKIKRAGATTVGITIKELN